MELTFIKRTSPLKMARLQAHPGILALFAHYTASPSAVAAAAINPDGTAKDDFWMNNNYNDDHHIRFDEEDISE